MPKRLTQNQKAGLPKRILIRRNDTVKVMSGRDKGKTGRVLAVDRDGPPAVVAPAVRVAGEADDVAVLVNTYFAACFIPLDVGEDRTVIRDAHGFDVLLDPFPRAGE